MKGKTRKPTITRREASRRIAEAGAEAYERAGSSGGDPKALSALLDVGTTVDVAGIKVRPLTFSIFLTLEELWKTKTFAAAEGTIREAMTLYTYCHPEQARACFTRKPEQFAEGCLEWSKRITIPQIRELSGLAAKHIADFYGTSKPAADRKKKNPARSKSGQRG